MEPLKAYVLDDDEPIPPPLVVNPYESPASLPRYRRKPKHAPNHLALVIGVFIGMPLIPLYYGMLAILDPEGMASVKRLFHFVFNLFR